jgi:hypothetical protein
MVAAACRDTDAERGEPGGDSLRCSRAELSPLVAMMLIEVGEEPASAGWVWSVKVERYTDSNDQGEGQ